jgi:poly-gamma-glutamate capsule biosynthesis protein CapA/YwtB (metallophosphatase superfamily)
MINIGSIKRKMGCGGALRHPQLIFCMLLLILLSSCQAEGPTVTLALLGDLMIGRGVNPTPASLAYLMPDLMAADLSLANLESPLTVHPPAANPGAGYNLCTLAGRAELIPDWGLTLLSLANNHRFDCSPDGRLKSAGILTSAGIHPVGPGPEPLYREIHGLKLAFLAFDDILTPVDTGTAKRAIQSARAEGRLVVVSIHWGAEYQQDASDRQKVLAQQFADAGAALVVGTHPHVLQPAQWIQTARGKTLVLYSLGNALFDQVGLADTRQSALVMVTLNAAGVRSARALPFEIDVIHSRIIQPGVQTADQIHAWLDLQ